MLAKTPQPLTRRLPLPPAVVRLMGPFEGLVESPTMRCRTAKALLRLHTDVPVTVTLQVRHGGRWQTTVYAGQDVQHLLKVRGLALRLRVDGTAEGLVDVIEVR